MATITVPDNDDIVRLALTLTEPIACEYGGGEWCPNCRLSTAVSQLRQEHNLPLDFLDGQLRYLTVGLPHCTTPEELKTALDGKLHSS